VDADVASFMRATAEVAELPHESTVGCDGKVDRPPEGVALPPLLGAGRGDPHGAVEKGFQPIVEVETQLLREFVARIELLKEIPADFVMQRLRLPADRADIADRPVNIGTHRVDDVFGQVGIGRSAHQRPRLVGKLLKADELVAGQETDVLLQRMAVERDQHRQIGGTDEQRHDDHGIDVMPSDRPNVFLNGLPRLAHRLQSSKHLIDPPCIGQQTGLTARSAALSPSMRWARHPLIFFKSD
jgi:hypothetical protein